MEVNPCMQAGPIVADDDTFQHSCLSGGRIIWLEFGLPLSRIPL